MPIVNVLPRVDMFEEAQRELTAFLRASVDVVGTSGIRRASDVWIEAMQGLDCPDNEFKKFFRKVTICAAGQLAGISGSGRPTEIGDLAVESVTAPALEAMAA
jgi:hypothetical protein